MVDKRISPIRGTRLVDIALISDVAYRVQPIHAPSDGSTT
jgi:hypothetical protein